MLLFLESSCMHHLFPTIRGLDLRVFFLRPSKPQRSAFVSSLSGVAEVLRKDTTFEKIRQVAIEKVWKTVIQVKESRTDLFV